jgi:hypothetical protein
MPNARWLGLGKIRESVGKKNLAILKDILKIKKAGFTSIVRLASRAFSNTPKEPS